MKYEEKTYDNTNTGVLFKANYKKNDKSPDYIGSLNVEGKDWTVFGKIRKSKAGKTFLGLSVAVPIPKDQPKQNDDVPFEDDDLNF